MNTIQFIPIKHIPLITPHVDLGTIIIEGIKKTKEELLAGDILVIAQKIVSKAEGQFVKLNEVTPSEQAYKLAQITGKDPRQVEVILWDTSEIIRVKPGLLIVEHRAGFISANAGLDHSNVAPEQEEMVLRLPQDADKSAARIRARIKELSAKNVPVLIIDSHGRPWRIGTTGVVIGLAGLKPIEDLRGQTDLFNIPLQHTEVAWADQVAAAASLVMGQRNEACPVVIARGLSYQADDTAQAKDILRDKKMDLFR